MHLRSKVLPFFSGKPPSRALTAPNPNPNSISFSRLSTVLNTLSSFHSFLENLFEEDHPSDEALSASYLHSSVEILDLLNEVSRQLNGLRHGRLLLLYAVQLLSSSDTFSIYKAREILQQWEVFAAENTISNDLKKDLVRSATEALEELAGEALDRMRDDLSGVSHGDVGEETREIVKRCLGQVGDAEEKKMAAELSAAAEKMGAELDCVAAAVESLFRAVIGARNAALNKYRVQMTS